MLDIVPIGEARFGASHDDGDVGIVFSVFLSDHCFGCRYGGHGEIQGNQGSDGILKGLSIVKDGEGKVGCGLGVAERGCKEGSQR